MKNHLGEKIYQTYAGWKSAVKKIDPQAKFEGNIDICSALGIGDWDGCEGCIYQRSESAVPK